jgi:hypothetical protein
MRPLPKVLFRCFIALPFLLVVSFSLTLAQENVNTTVTPASPIEIPTTPFNDASAIHAQEDRFKAEGRMLDYGVSVSTQCKTSLSDFQTKLAQAIAANSPEAARKIVGVGEQTVAQAQVIDDRVFHFADYANSPAGRAHTAADANLAAARQTLKQMEAALLPVVRNEQTAQDDKLTKVAAEAWDRQMAGSLGDLPACGPASGVNCNVFVGQALETVYHISDFKAADGSYLLANQIADFLMKSPHWTLIGSADSQSVLDQAANSANSRPVVAVWRNPDPDPKAHGHVAFIGPGDLRPSTKWGLNVPNSAGYSIDDPKVRYIGDKLSRAFGKDKKSSVLIYERLNP